MGPDGLDFDHARDAVSRHARVTPLLGDPVLSDRVGRDVWVKAECLQHTGSFKVRGAASRLEALSSDERSRGVVACSSGNHGRAVAFVARRLGVPATIYVPSWVDPVKLAGIRDAGAEAVLAGASFDESEAIAVRASTERGSTYVSAYDDPWVIAGQGTIADEVVDQLPEAPPVAFLVPLSGGGLVGGMAAALDRRFGAAVPACVAVSARMAAVMLESLRAGRPVACDESPTVASALAGGIGRDNRYSFGLVRDLVRRHVTVSEEQIEAGMRHAAADLRLVSEGAGAVALAALLHADASVRDLPPGPIVALVSGGNVAAETLARVLRGP